MTVSQSYARVQVFECYRNYLFPMRTCLSQVSETLGTKVRYACSKYNTFQCDGDGRQKNKLPITFKFRQINV